MVSISTIYKYSVSQSIFFVTRTTRTCENVNKPEKADNGDTNSITAKLLSGKCICEKLIYTQFSLHGQNKFDALEFFAVFENFKICMYLFHGFSRKL
jgi:hypothetical protein